MTQATETAPAFRFSAASGENLAIWFPVAALAGRRSRVGRLVVTLPPPFQHIEIAHGERVGAAKLAEIKRAVEVLGGSLSGEPT